MYFPENDLALAAGTASYTPPPAARQLHMAGEALPLWMAEPGDRFVCSGLNARWFDETCRRFGISDVDVYDHRATDLEPSPWGWSAASRRAMADAGYPMKQMPDDATLARLRELSHRRTAAALADAVAADVPFAVAETAVEARTVEEVQAYMRSHPAVLAKAPWSCSGRGLVRGRNMPPEAFVQQCAGVIRRQGSVMLEPEHDKILDFALLYEADGHGGVTRRGISLFETNARGGYTANALAPQEVLRRRVEDVAGAGKLDAVDDAVMAALPALTAGYRGPLGVDMLVCADGTIDAAVEVNLRHTMGFVALGVARHLAPGTEATLAVVPHPQACEGSFDLTPANPWFAFRVFMK